MEVIKKVVYNKEQTYSLEGIECIDKKFQKLKIGTILQVKPLEELISLGLEKEKAEIIEQCKFEFNDRVLSCLMMTEGENFGSISDISVRQIFVDVFDKDEGEEPVLYDLVSTITDEQKELIKNEMIAKISEDIPSIKNMLCRYRESIDGGSKISNEALMRILDAWAENKMYLYIGMGNNISINKDVEVIPTKSQICNSWREMCSTFEVGKCIKDIDIDYVINNSIKMSYFRDMVMSNLSSSRKDLYKDRLTELYNRNKNSTMKLTKCISKVFDYNLLDIAVSQVLQSKVQTQKLWMSIHPLDYLTCSITSSWTSCHKPGGQYQKGPLSYLCDNSTLMSFACSDSKVTLSCGIKDFKWYDKNWRELIYVHPKTYTATFYREYPTKIGNLSDELRYFYEETISSVLGVENMWEDRSLKDHLVDVSTLDGDRLHYNDPLKYSSGGDSCSLHTVSLPKVDYMSKLKVGSEGLCFVCGSTKEIHSSQKCRAHR